MFMWLKRIFLIIIILGLITNAQSAFPPVNFTEEDGSPSVYPVKVEVSDGTLTDDGSATISIDTSGTTTTGWTHSGTNIYPTTITDNVGIGTTLPLGLLQVGTSPTPGLIVLPSGRVGIGTTTPAVTLDIHDSSSQIAIYNGAIDLVHYDNSYPNPYVFGYSYRGTKDTPLALQENDLVFSFAGEAYDGSGGQDTTFTKYEVDGTVSTGTAPGRITFWTSPDNSANIAERMRIDRNGNVGIGTTAPTEKLEITGDMKITDATPHLEFEGTGDDFEITANNNQFWISNLTDTKKPFMINQSNLIQFYEQAGFIFPDGAPADNQILKYDLALGRMAWEADAGGGAGYTNLTEFVDQTAWRVFYSNTSGDVTELALGAANTVLTSNGATSAPTFEAMSGEATTVSDTTTVNLTLTGADITADGLYTAGDDLTLTGIDFDVDSTVTRDTEWNTIDFLTGTATASLSGEIVAGTAPGGELGGTWASPTIDDSLSVTSWTLVTPNIGVATGTSLTATGNIVTLGNVGIGMTNPTVLLQVGTSPNAPLVVLAGGNVGIGTSNPVMKLDVIEATAAAANVRFRGGEGNDANLRLDADDGDNNADIWRLTSKASNNNFQIENYSTGAWVAGLSIDSSGNVGIGNTAPQKLLDVCTTPGKGLIVTTGGSVGIGNTLATGLLQVGTHPLQGLTVLTTGLVGISNTAPTGILQVGTSPSAPVLFVNGVNVGIGKTAPAQKLDINGGMLVGGTYPSYFGGNLGIGTTAPIGLLQVGTSPGTATLTITGGNVGIGITLPTTKLYIYAATTAPAATLSIIGSGTGAGLTGGLVLKAANGTCGYGTLAAGTGPLNWVAVTCP